MTNRKFTVSLRVKLLLLVAFPIAMYVCSTLYWMNTYEKDVTKLSKSLFETTDRVNTLILNADRDLYQSLTAYQVLGSPGLDSETARQMKQDMADNAKQATDRMEQAIGIIRDNDLLNLKKKDGGDSILSIANAFKADFPVWLDLANKGIDTGSNKVYDKKLMDQFGKAREGINIIGEIVEEHAAAEIAGINNNKNILVKSSSIALFICLLITLLIAFIIIRKISRTAKYVLDLTNAVSVGDLRDCPAINHSSDELGRIAQSIILMKCNVRKLILTISDNALQVSAASQQMNTSSRQSAAAAAQIAADIIEVNAGIETQAKGAEESARAIDEMAVGIGRMAENTSNISDYSINTSNDAEQGREELDRLDAQMQGIKEVIGKLAGIVTKLNERSNEIGSIAENITSFSNQTSILSLNASIEAARAGEHGRGFAVVAGEIRKLAAQSLQSADIINQLVTSTQDEMAHASDVMETTLGEVAIGGELMKKVNDSFTLIRDSIQSIAAQIHDNSAITEEMSASSEEVSATMEQSAHAAQNNLSSTRNVAAATQEQLALMEEIERSASHLQEIVNELDRSVSTFVIR